MPDYSNVQIFAKNICIKKLKFVSLQFTYAKRHINHNFMPKPSFITARQLSALIDAYFNEIKETHQPEEKLTERPKQNSVLKKAKPKELENATITGLALFLGFSSRAAFDDYLKKGKFANTLKRGQLLVESAYEKKLHRSSMGAVFALKSMGWNGNDEGAQAQNAAFKSMPIEFFDSPSQPAENENEVTL
jgi:hypothetical protein